MAIAIPPAIGFGRIGQDMVGIRYDSLELKWNNYIMFNINIEHHVIYMCILKPHFSCLPTWSEDSLSDIAYIWLICIGGGLLPTIIMAISHILSLVNLRKNPELKQVYFDQSIFILHCHINTIRLEIMVIDPHI